MLGNYKHLFFDLDNTILDFDHASDLAFKSLLEKKGFKHPNAYQVYHKINSQVWSEFEEGVITAEELRAKRFDLFLEAMQWRGNGSEWNAQYLQNVIKHTKYVEGADSLIRELSKSHNIHIVTNGLREVQRPRIKIAKLDDYVSSITVSDEIGYAKPDKNFFKIAFDNAGNPNKTNVLMIGDSYNSDIIGAKNSGIDSCWLNVLKVQKADSVNTHEIQSIAELAQFKPDSR